MNKPNKKELMREYKAGGHTHKEVAERFGVSVRYSIMVCKGISPQWKKKTEKDISNFIREMLPAFEYVGGFETVDGYINIRCKECGAIMSRSLIGIRHGNGVRCHNCTDIKADERRKAKRLDRELRDIVRQWSRWHKGKQLSFKVCQECGDLFIPTNGRWVYCSEVCNRKGTNRKKDKRLNASNIIDRDITLHKLYKRDKGKCYLCGCLCDWEDKKIDANGHTIVGNNYPSIDHVTPLKLGGMHSWGNVRLACHRCNTLKRDSPLSL